MARKLAANVYVADPETGDRLLLRKGSTPEPELAALVRNPYAWEGGSVPSELEQSTSNEQVRVVVSPVPGDRKGYEQLVRPDLDAIAGARGVDVPSSANKPQVIDALMAADQVLYEQLAELTDPQQ